MSANLKLIKKFVAYSYGSQEDLKQALLEYRAMNHIEKGKQMKKIREILPNHINNG